ncbi:MAG: hypothetical protein ACYDEN_10230 [Acidimicrobiales bacterium]
MVLSTARPVAAAVAAMVDEQAPAIGEMVGIPGEDPHLPVPPPPVCNKTGSPSPASSK